MMSLISPTEAEIWGFFKNKWTVEVIKFIVMWLLNVSDKKKINSTGNRHFASGDERSLASDYSLLVPQ